MAGTQLSDSEYLIVAREELEKHRAAIRIARKALQQASSEGYSGATDALAEINVALARPTKNPDLEQFKIFLTRVANAVRTLASRRKDQN